MPRQALIRKLSYEEEKLEGVRRPNGVRYLSRLKPRHRQVITLHIAGHSNNDIAKVMNLSPATISLVLSDPLSQTIIQQALDDAQGELSALTLRSIDTIREAMDPTKTPKIETRLRGVDRFVKLYEVTEIKKKGRTAEDVVQDLLGSINNTLKRIDKEQKIKVINPDPNPDLYQSKES